MLVNDDTGLRFIHFKVGLFYALKLGGLLLFWLRFEMVKVDFIFTLNFSSIVGKRLFLLMRQLFPYFTLFSHSLCTKAFSLGLTGMFINRKGREASGIVEEGAEYDALKQELIGKLRELRDPTPLELIRPESGPSGKPPGDTVLLAPACSSFDMFRSYAERGDVFQQAVENLGGQP